MGSKSSLVRLCQTYDRCDLIDFLSRKIEKLIHFRSVVVVAVVVKLHNISLIEERKKRREEKKRNQSEIRLGRSP